MSSDGTNSKKEISILKDELSPEAKSDTTHDDLSTPTTSTLSIIDRFIDEPRALNVVVIGGGIAGILAGILLPRKVPSINLKIYEKNHDFGGTWLENVYPGVRCDIPSHVYQSTFAPNTQWSEEFSAGAEIRDYWQRVARNHDVYRYAKFQHRIDHLQWNSDAGIWAVTKTDLQSGLSSTEEAHFVLTATGRFNAWKLPDYPGIADYDGILRHASNWDPSADLEGKSVAVIGNGASGIQLTANLQKVVGRLDHYVRGRTWIATSWAGDERQMGPQPISQDLRNSFVDKPETYLAYRKDQEDKYWRNFRSFLLNSEENEKLKDSFIDVMKKRLAKKPELLDEIIPEFSPNCRRLTPGPGYLEAVSEENVEYITTPISRFTKAGIETTDGKLRQVDAVFCATGANRDSVPTFPIVAHDKDLRDLWAQDGEHGFPYTYMGIATPGFPNLLFLHGPHATGPSGTVPHSIETQLAMLAKILRKVSREGIKSIEPSVRAADDFVEYCDIFFATTVMSGGCSSWYNGGKPGGRVTGLWPGSANHLALVRREPRWEDWNYEYLEEASENRLLWYLGNGWTRKEVDLTADMTPYLHIQGQVDLRDVHESWWSVP